jgi:hypothetical protein
VVCEDADAKVPVPLVDHSPEVEPVELAEIGTGPLPAHVEYGPPGLLVGTGWIVSVAFPIAGLAQGAIAFAVHVSVRLPAVMSRALGVYVVLGVVVLPNVPVPLLDHVPEDEFEDEAEMETEDVVEQILYGPPALLVGAGWIVSVALPVAGVAHGAIAFAVHVSVRLPAVMSAALGM